MTGGVGAGAGAGGAPPPTVPSGALRPTALSPEVEIAGALSPAHGPDPKKSGSLMIWMP